MYEVLVPTAPFENRQFASLDEAPPVCYDLAQEFGQATIMYGRCHIYTLDAE